MLFSFLCQLDLGIEKKSVRSYNVEKMWLFNKSKNILLAKKVKIADGFWMRMKGLMGEKKLEESFAFVIPNCSSIHTFFMSIPIDVLFIHPVKSSAFGGGATKSPLHELNKESRIMKAVSELAPFRFSGCRGREVQVIELPAGTIRQTKTEAGDILLLR